MIFVGDGALLKRALEYCLFRQYPIDYVFSSSEDLNALLEKRAVYHTVLENGTIDIELAAMVSSDGIVLSINNGMIFSKKFLSAGFRVYNIHNGIVPAYRGLPEVCILFAILQNEREYGVSLHQIDEGIDTGCCFDQITFELKDSDTFQSVMLHSLSQCDLIFQNNIDAIIKNRLVPMQTREGVSNLYTYKHLKRLQHMKGLSTYERATNLGIYRMWFPDLARVIADVNKRYDTTLR